MRRSGIFVCVLVAGCMEARRPTPPGPSPSMDGGIVDGSGGADQGGGGGDQGGVSTDAGMAVCDPATPMRLASPQDFIEELAVDEAHVYWRSILVGPYPGFYRVPKGGGEVTPFAGIHNRHEDGIDADLVMDGDGLFIVEGGVGGIGEGAGSVGRFDGRGDYMALASGDRYPCGWVGHPRRVSTNASRVYWVEEIGHTAVVPEPGPSCDSNIKNSRYLRSVSKRGGDARGPLRIPVLDIAAGEEFVYFAEGTTLYRLPKDGDTWKPWVAELPIDGPLAVAGGEIYVGGRDGSVYAVHLDRGEVRSVAGPSGAGSRVRQFAFDERYVYWASVGDGGGIRRAPKSGGPSELIIPAERSPWRSMGGTSTTCRAGPCGGAASDAAATCASGGSEIACSPTRQQGKKERKYAQCSGHCSCCHPGDRDDHRSCAAA